MLLEKYRRLILSRRGESPELLPDEPGLGMTFLKKMFCETKMMVDPKAQTRPEKLEKEMSNEHASMTPRVRGSNDR